MDKTVKNNIDLVAYCRAQLGRPYWYGTFGQRATKALYENRKEAYPGYYKDNDYPQQYGQKVHDCIGLVKGYMWTDDADSTHYAYQSHGFNDMSADMCYNHCTRKGEGINTMPDLPGVLVFMKGHVGVYAGNGEVIEARGHKFGVVLTKLAERPWRRWALLDEIQYIGG